jgi:CDP-glucose 4,6-dehydratase
MKSMSKNFWKNKKVLITGHTGFKGSWLTILLNYLGAKVAGYSLDPISHPNFFDNVGLKKLVQKDIRADILNKEKLSKLILNFKPTIVLHLAAQSSVLVSYKNDLETVKTNVVGTSNVLNILKNYQFIKSCIVVTTDKVYENFEKKIKFSENEPLGGYDIYSSSKAACEILTSSYIKSFFSGKKLCNVATVRSGNCIGGGDWTKDRIIKDCVEKFLNNKKLILRNPRATRPWQHVIEPLIGYLILAEKLYKDKKNQYVGSWNFGPNLKNNLSVLQVAQYAKKRLNSISKIKIKKSKLYESQNLSLDSKKAYNFLKWNNKLSDLESLNLTLDWYKKFYSLRNKEKFMMIDFSLKQIKDYLKKCNF